MRPKMAVHYSSASDLWSTPEKLFRTLDREFRFTLDVCASVENAKCERYFTKDDNGLMHRWEGVCWCNPPYGNQIGRWVAKASMSATRGATVVCLIPSRTDTAYWHEYVWDDTKHQARPGVEIRFLKGRLKFGNSPHPAPFPSCVVIFRPPPFSGEENRA